ncbi:Lysine decarboxylase-like protein [Lasiodiplodia theobromae]|uniref:Lysine decarboxylase-like protein n=1 Tax=Lasiodiplodia theobromae TaxID=45133 RepID=UPI0015C355D3|nr:Lysine decarboxylase-like protein [Lasiodiplodia theobromae]KAF4542903.1 Lysine decarboxylase-like protein [Lasiodiplodia theobromae]
MSSAVQPEQPVPATQLNGAVAADPRPVICVFCGASSGTSPKHLEAARSLAQALHANNMRLVYGGGTVGLMGEVARTLVSLSGPDAVHGIIPAALVKLEQNYEKVMEEQQQNGSADNNGEVLNGPGPRNVIDEKIYGRTTIVKDMHTRKSMMAQEVIAGGPGGGFVALSGGYGTMEELMEVTTWNQLGIHNRGVVVFNVDGYYDGLISWVKNAVTSGFVSPTCAGILVEALSAEEVIQCLQEYKNAEGRFKLNWNEN